ncbi:MAG: hypothetical protein ABTA22_07825, partial [Clostridia bacterium]
PGWVEHDPKDILESQIVSRLLRTTGLAVLILPAFRLLQVAPVAYERQDRQAYFCPETLVRWKIRLNN